MILSSISWHSIDCPSCQAHPISHSVPKSFTQCSHCIPLLVFIMFFFARQEISWLHFLCLQHSICLAHLLHPFLCLVMKLASFILRLLYSGYFIWGFGQALQTKSQILLLLVWWYISESLNQVYSFSVVVVEQQDYHHYHKSHDDDYKLHDHQYHCRMSRDNRNHGNSWFNARTEQFEYTCTWEEETEEITERFCHHDDDRHVSWRCFIMSSDKKQTAHQISFHCSHIHDQNISWESKEG